ncbi:UNVERIFIED_CONTAM: ABC-type multidrug transport system fused ATPase/permease subunit [Paenibacillus sp. PvR008]
MYPNLLQRLIDNAIIPGDFGKVPALALTVLGVVIVKGFMQFLHGFFGGRLGNYLAYRLRMLVTKSCNFCPSDIMTLLKWVISCPV